MKKKSKSYDVDINVNIGKKSQIMFENFDENNNEMNIKYMSYPTNENVATDRELNLQ